MLVLVLVLVLVLEPGRWRPRCVRAPVLGLYGALGALVARPFRLRPARCPKVWAQAALVWRAVRPLEQHHQRAVHLAAARRPPPLELRRRARRPRRRRLGL